MLTVKQAAAMLAVSPETIRRWVAAGRIPYVRLPNGYFRFRPDDLERMMKSGTGGTVVDRYAMPPFDPSGLNGPRDLSETTHATQHRYLNGPEKAGLPGYVVINGGTWEASEDGRAWRQQEAPER